MTMLTKPVLVLVLTAGLAACASQPSGPPASTTSQPMTLPPATTAASSPASSMPGMSAEQHQRMMRQGQPMQGMDHSRMSAEEHRRMMQPR